MSQVDFNDPCILFALGRESGPFRRLYRPHQSFPGAPVWARFAGRADHTVLIVETGMGQANVARALDWILSEPKLGNVPYVPSLLVFAGFAGALADSLHIGDVVVASEVVAANGKRWSTTWPIPGDQPPSCTLGRLLTTDRLVATAEEKRRLADLYSALAVDMESALFADRCGRAGIPFACVRAISDEATVGLSPALVSVMSGGAVSPCRLAIALARHPLIVGELWRLGRDTKVASQRLATVLQELLS